MTVLNSANSFNDFVGKQIFVAYDRAGYCYGVFASRTKKRLLEVLGSDATDLRIERSGRYCISDPHEVDLIED